MADKNHEKYQPPATNGYSRNGDSESLNEGDEHRKKRIRLAAYIAAFVVFQVIVILVFVLVVMKVRTPEFRIGQNIVMQSWTNIGALSPSFYMVFTASFSIKNNNFGPYKYDSTVVNFTYNGVLVGQVLVPKRKANFMSTKKRDLTVLVSSSTLTNTSRLESELNSGVLTLHSHGRMQGKSEIMFVFKKRKATNMNCTLNFNVNTRMIESVECK